MAIELPHADDFEQAREAIDTTHWIDQAGEHRYCRVNSTMTPHALKGLMQMFD